MPRGNSTINSQFIQSTNETSNDKRSVERTQTKEKLNESWCFEQIIFFRSAHDFHPHLPGNGEAHIKRANNIYVTLVMYMPILQ